MGARPLVAADRAMTLAATATIGIVIVTLLRSLEGAGAERWAHVLLPPWTRLLATVNGAVPWSWSLASLLLGVALSAWAWRRATWRGRLTSTLFLVLAASVWFEASWGVHYRRVPLQERMVAAEQTPAGERLAPAAGSGWAEGCSAVERVGAEASRGPLASTAPAGAPSALVVDGDALVARLADVVRKESHARPDGSDPAASRNRGDAAIRAIAQATPQLVRAIDGTDVGVPERVKRLPRGTLLALGAAGVVSPWLLEPHLDGALPAAAAVAVAAHELAHAAGIAPEDEAQAVGVLAALHSGDAFARYSVALFELDAAAARLPAEAREALLASLPPGALDDLARARAAASAHRNVWLGAISSWFYDRFLRAHGVADGAASYGGSGAILEAALASGWFPKPPGAPDQPSASDSSRSTRRPSTSNVACTGSGPARSTPASRSASNGNFEPPALKKSR